MLLPFTGLPFPRAHTPTQKRREKEIVEGIGVPPKEIEYSDSSKSLVDEEESEDDPPQVAPYVPTCRRAPGQKVHCPVLEKRKQQQSQVYQGLLETEDLMIAIEVMLG